MKDARTEVRQGGGREIVVCFGPINKTIDLVAEDIPVPLVRTLIYYRVQDSASSAMSVLVSILFDCKMNKLRMPINNFNNRTADADKIHLG